MKKTLILLLSLTLSTLCAQAGEKENEKLIVTLNDGTTVEGYEVNNIGTRFRNMFRKSGSIPDFIKISPETDGKNAKTYKAEEIKGFKYASDTTIQFESQYFHAIIPFVKDAKTRGLFQVVTKRPNGTIYVYDTYSTTDSKNLYTSTLRRTYGIMLRGDDRIYNIIVNDRIDLSYLILSLKRKGPEKLLEIYEEYFDNEEHCKNFVDDPTILITLYDNYLKTNPVISREENK